MFNKGQAQKWWAENHDKVLELYNVRSSNHPPPTLPGSEEEVSIYIYIYITNIIQLMK